jgi:hypothetical protein
MSCRVLILFVALVQLEIGVISFATAQEQEPSEDQDSSLNETVEEEELSLDFITEDDEKERSAIERLWEDATDNLRFNIDVVSRIETTRNRGKAAGLNTIGLDVHKVWSNSSGDIGTFVLQPYVVRRDNALPMPPHIEDDDDWDLEFHDFYFNLTRFGKGRTNLKIGHFDIPFGLEPLEDTHFTIRQLIPFQNLGAKKDWGISLNGTMPWFDYEVSAGQGAGVEYNSLGKNYALAGRIGTPSPSNFVVGASVFYGQMFDPHRLHRWQAGVPPPTRVDIALGRDPTLERGDDQIIRRLRAGIDASWVIDQFTIRGESSVGRDYDQDVFNSILEIDWTSADQNLRAYAQGVYLAQRNDDEWNQDVVVRVGADWRITKEWSVSAQYNHELETYTLRRNDAKFILQTRLRF